MFNIPIILGSTRTGRMSPRVARFMAERLRSSGRVQTEVLDLLEYNFPMMEERLRFTEQPPDGLVDFAGRIASASAVVIVAPEYNNGYPAVLKNAIDYLLPEFTRKPVGIVTVSAGGFGGINCLAQLRLVMLGLGALPIPAALPVSRVQASFDEDGKPLDASYEPRANTFVEELLWYTEAIDRQRSQG